MNIFWLQFIGIVVSSYLVGWLITQLIFQRILKQLVASSSNKIDDYLLSAAGAVIPVWVAAITLWNWLELYSPLRSQLSSLIRDGIVVIVFLQNLWVAQNLLVKILNVFLRRSPLLPESTVVNIIGRSIVIAFGSIFLLQYLGISIVPVLTALGVGGLAVALALQPTLENLFSGLQLLLSRKIIPGNYVELESGQSGIVEDITWRNTIIRSLSNNRIVIPNKVISDAVLINYHQPGKDMSVIVEMGVGYESDLEYVEKTVVEIATETMKNLGEVSDPSFKPFIRYSKFADSAIEFSVILRVKEYVGKYELTHEFIKAVHKRFKKEKINIPYPVQTVILSEPKAA